MELIEILGVPFIAFLALAFVAYNFFSLSPLIWPAIRAFRAKRRLPRPWLFTAVVGVLVYGSISLMGFVFALPAHAYLVYLVPQLEDLGYPYGSWFVAAARFFLQWWWIVLPPAMFAATALLTRRLAEKWSRICAALAA